MLSTWNQTFCFKINYFCYIIINFFIFLLNLWGLYDFLIGLQNSFFAYLYLSLAHPSFIFHQWNSLCFWLHLSEGFCSHLQHLYTGTTESETWKLLALLLCSAHAVREREGRKSLREVPAFPGDYSCQQVLQRPVWEMEKWACTCSQARGETH